MRLPQTWAWLFILFWGIACLGQTKSGCLSYQPAVVHLRGTLTRQTFPGPPEYASVKKGDRPETFWILVLEKPVCVDQRKMQSDLYPAESNVRRVQLVLTPETYKQYKGLVGEKVIATGPLFARSTIHHRTAVLLTVKTLERSGGPR